MVRLVALVAVAVAPFAAALTTPRVARDMTGGHAALAARLAARAPQPVALEPLAVPQRLTRRAQRCPARHQSSAASAPASTAAAPVNVAPAPSSHPPAAAPSKPAEPAEPAPVKQAPPPPAKSEPPPPPPAPQSGSCGEQSTEGTMSGDGTFYGTGLGACGITNNDSDPIVAVSKLLYDTFPGYAGPGTNPNNNPICGKKLTAHYQGKSVRVTVTDRCEACACGSLDFSPTAFSQLADQSLGRIHGVTWSFD